MSYSSGSHRRPGPDDLRPDRNSCFTDGACGYLGHDDAPDVLHASQGLPPEPYDGAAGHPRGAARGEVTVVTYGACCRIALGAAEKLAQVGVDAEILDMQTLLPFDLPGRYPPVAQKDQQHPLLV